VVVVGPDVVVVVGPAVVVVVGPAVVVITGPLIANTFQVSSPGVTEKLAGGINQNPNLLPPKFIILLLLVYRASRDMQPLYYSCSLVFNNILIIDEL
jgi:hypothetical protein